MQMSALGQLLIVSGGGQGLLAFSAFKLEVRLRVCVYVSVCGPRRPSATAQLTMSCCPCVCVASSLGFQLPVHWPWPKTKGYSVLHMYDWGSTWSDPRSYDGSCKFLHDENPFSPPEGQSRDRWWGELQVEHKQCWRAFTAQLTACLYTYMIISIMCYI